MCGTIEFIMKDPNGSLNIFVGGKFTSVPDDHSFYSIFQFDNKFFIESDKVEIKKSNKISKLLKKDNNKVDRTLF
jgi:hypothetical protein